MSAAQLVQLLPTLLLVLLVVMTPLLSSAANAEVLPNVINNIDWGYTAVQPVRNTSRTYRSDWKVTYLTCGGVASSGVLTVGNTQSPINFQQVPVNGELMPISFDLSTTIRNFSIMVLPQTKLSLEIAGTSYESTANNIAAMVDGNTKEFYSLHHVDVKSPSEHTFGGGHRDMEVQLHYRSSTLPVTHAGYNYIVSTTFIAKPLARSEFVHSLISGGVASNANLSDTLIRSPTPGTSPLKVRQTYRTTRMRLSSVAPVSRNYYRYYGSLTEPPCTGNAVWNVYTEPVYMGMEQLNTVRRLLQLDIPVAGNKPMHLNFSKMYLREDGEVVAGSGLALKPETVQLGNHRPLHLTPTPPQPLTQQSQNYQQVSYKTKAHLNTQRPYTIAERYKVTQFKDIIGDQLLAHQTIPNAINGQLGSISVAAVVLAVSAIPIALLALCIGWA